MYWENCPNFWIRFFINLFYYFWKKPEKKRKEVKCEYRY